MAREDVFADTSALYAFVNKRDAYHVEARRIVERLLHARRQLIASDYFQRSLTRSRNKLASSVASS